MKLGPFQITGRAKTETPQVTVVEKKPEEKLSLGSILEVPTAATTLTNQITISGKLLEANQGWVYRNNDVIAKEVAQVELELFAVRVVGRQIEYVQIDTHPALDAIDKFNESSSKYHGFYITQSHKKLAGDAFWYIDGTGPRINNIFPLQPDKVTLNLGDFSDATDVLIESYTYKDTVDGKQIEQTYSPDEIVHFKAPNPNNMYRGKSAVEALAQDIDLDNLGIETRRKFYENGGMFNFVLTSEHNLNDTQVQQLSQQVKRFWTGVKNAFKIPIFGGGLKVQTVQPSARDQEELKTSEWLRDKIMVGFGNSKASLGIIDDVNRASHESAIAAWKQTTVRTEIVELVDTLNEFFLPRFGRGLVFGFKDVVPENREAKVKEVVDLRDADVINQNEGREYLGYDPVEGGDEFSRDRAPLIQQVPEELKYVNLKKVMRRDAIYKELEIARDIYRSAHELATKVVKGRRNKEVVEPKQHASFSNEQVWAYWEKQIKMVEVHEERFLNMLKQFIHKIENVVISNLPEEVGKDYETKELFDRKELEREAQRTFRVVLAEVAVAAGNRAADLAGIDDPYIGLDMEAVIKKNIKRFTASMLDTEREKLSGIIQSGIQEGLGIPEIRRNLENAFSEFEKVQSERIARTEVLRTSNQAAIDAWSQSDRVVGKQWLTAEDGKVDPDCEDMNGKIIPLESDYFKKGDEFHGLTLDYSNVGEPPLHPNCRCVVLPVFAGEMAFNSSELKNRLEDAVRIKELEDQIDKRKTEFKEMRRKFQEEKADDAAYIKALEGYLDRPRP